MNWVRHVGSTTWFQTTRYCCAKVEFNSSNWVRLGSSTTFETGRTLGLIQTLSRSRSLRPDFGRNADWLLEQFYKIWLAVGNAESWKRLDPPSAERKVDFAVFFIVIWSYGRKICLNMYHGNSENSYGCSYLLWIRFIYGTNVSVSRSWIPLQVVDR